jgi:hypothetical protein
MDDNTTAIETEIMPEQAPKRRKPQQKVYKKTQLAMAMISAGETPENALKLLNGKDKIHPQSVYALKRKYKNHSLQAPGMVSAAKSQIKRILKGEAREVTQQKATKDGQVIEYTEQIVPSDTNIIAAASMVYDRYEPVVRQTLNVNVDVDPVDLGQFRNE